MFNARNFRIAEEDFLRMSAGAEKACVRSYKFFE